MVLLLEAVSLGVVDTCLLPYHATPSAPLVNLKEGQQEAEAEKLEEGVRCKLSEALEGRKLALRKKES